MVEEVRASTPSIAKNWGRVLLLSFAGAMIYGLPYFRSYYYDAYLAEYQLTNAQMGSLGSAFGVLGLLSYLVGGVLTDRLSAKKLLVFSLIATGAGGFLHLVFTSYYALLGIYALWGLTSLLTFWPALMKMVRLQASEEEQSRAYGIFEGGRGAVSAAHLAVATAIFGVFAAAAPGAGLRWIIVFYSTVPILIGLMLIVVLKDPQEVVVDGEVAAPDRFHWPDLLKVIRLPAIWLVVCILFCTYMFNMAFYYFTPYASNVIGLSAVLAAVVTVMAQYIRPFAAPAGGFAADRFGRAPTMLVGFLGLAVGMGIIIGSSGLNATAQVVLLFVGCATVYLAMYSNFGIYFSLLSEGGVPVQYAGVAIGIVSTLGYLPEIVAPLIAGNLLDRFPGQAGYHYLFYGLVGCALVGALLCLVWIKVFGRQPAAHDSESDAIQKGEAA